MIYQYDPIREAIYDGFREIVEQAETNVTDLVDMGVYDDVDDMTGGVFVDDFLQSILEDMIETRFFF